MANSLGTAAAFSGNANSLASGSYVSLGVINFTSAPPDDCLVEVSLQASTTPTGNKQAVIFARSSVDGTNFSDAPTSTTELNAVRLGSLALPDTSAHRSIGMPLARLFGGALPEKVEIYVKNDCGVALASTSQGGQYRFETFG